MIFPESAIERDPFPSVGEKAQSTEHLGAQRAWARDAEIRAAASPRQGRLWLGIAIATPAALAFWIFAWFALNWAVHL